MTWEEQLAEMQAGLGITPMSPRVFVSTTSPANLAVAQVTCACGSGDNLHLCWANGSKRWTCGECCDGW